MITDFHAEAQAVISYPLSQGGTMSIKGILSPCPGCKGLMIKVAKLYKAKVIYQWKEDGKVQTWMTDFS